MTNFRSADVCAICGKTWGWHKEHWPEHVFVLGSDPEAPATPLVSMTIDHLESAFEEITLLYDDLNLHPSDHPVEAVRFRVTRIHEHLIHARNQRVLERTAR